MVMEGDRVFGGSGLGGKRKYRKKETKGVLGADSLDFVDGVWAGLVRAARGRESDERRESRWVMANLLVPLEEIVEAEIPSQQAVGLLWCAKREGSDFVKAIYTKMMPSRSVIDAEQEHMNDDRTQEQLIADFRKMFRGEGDG